MIDPEIIIRDVIVQAEKNEYDRKIHPSLHTPAPLKRPHRVFIEIDASDDALKLIREYYREQVNPGWLVK